MASSECFTDDLGGESEVSGAGRALEAVGLCALELVYRNGVWIVCYKILILETESFGLEKVGRVGRR